MKKLRITSSAHFQGDDEDRSNSEGMYTSVICRDEFAFSTLNQAKSQALAAIPKAFQPAIFGSTAELFEICKVWGTGAALSRANAPTVSDIPTLIIVGEYDPGTPPRWGKLTAKTLSNAYYFEFPGSGHSLLSDVDCAIKAANEFFANPTTEPDRSCINAMTSPIFEAP